jgi:hypothetical protein
MYIMSKYIVPYNYVWNIPVWLRYIIYSQYRYLFIINNNNNNNNNNYRYNHILYYYGSQNTMYAAV